MLYSADIIVCFYFHCLLVMMKLKVFSCQTVVCVWDVVPFSGASDFVPLTYLCSHRSYVQFNSNFSVFLAVVRNTDVSPGGILFAIVALTKSLFSSEFDSCPYTVSVFNTYSPGILQVHKLIVFSVLHTLIKMS